MIEIAIILTIIKYIILLFHRLDYIELNDEENKNFANCLMVITIIVTTYKLYFCYINSDFFSIWFIPAIIMCLYRIIWNNALSAFVSIVFNLYIWGLLIGYYEPTLIF